MSNIDPSSRPYENLQPERFGHTPVPGDNTANGATPPKSGTGKCLLWGCLITVAMSLLLVVGGGFAAYWFFTSQLQKYTDEQPAEIPVVEASQEEIDAIQKRIDAFKQTVEADTATTTDAIPSGDEPVADANEATTPQPTEPPAEPPTEPLPSELVLSDKELNALISANPDLRGRVYVTIQDGKVMGQVSIPTDFVPGGQGRFFNADGQFDVSMEDGVLMVRLVSASVKGEPIPAEIMEGFGRENLAKEAYKNEENAKVLRRFESIEVIDDKIVLRLKGADDAAAPNITEPDAAVPSPGE